MSLVCTIYWLGNCHNMSWPTSLWYQMALTNDQHSPSKLLLLGLYVNQTQYHGIFFLGTRHIRRLPPALNGRGKRLDICPRTNDAHCRKHLVFQYRHIAMNDIVPQCLLPDKVSLIQVLDPRCNTCMCLEDDHENERTNRHSYLMLCHCFDKSLHLEQHLVMCTDHLTSNCHCLWHCIFLCSLPNHLRPI